MTDDEREWWKTYRMAWKAAEQRPTRDRSGVEQTVGSVQHCHEVAVAVANLAHGERATFDKHLGDAIRPLVLAARNAVKIHSLQLPARERDVAIETLHGVLVEHRLWED